MKAVVLDTNAWLLPFTDKTDVERELERLLGAFSMHLPQSVQRELETLAKGQGQVARAAQGALKLAGRATLHPGGLPGDDGVLQLARNLQAVVLSNDRLVLQEARKAGLGCIGSRGQGALQWRHR